MKPNVRAAYLAWTGGALLLASLKGTKEEFSDRQNNVIFSRELLVRAYKSATFNPLVIAVELNQSRKYPFAKMRTRGFLLNKLEHAIQTLVLRSAC